MQQKSRTAVMSLVVGGAMLFTACDGGTAIGVAPASNTTVPASVTIVQPAQGPFSTVICSNSSFFVPHVDLFLSAVRPVRMDTVTFQLIDGSHVGAPAVTIPQPSLSASFGSLFIAPGTTRAFTFHPQLPCGGTGPRPLLVAVTLIDDHGVSQTVTAQGAPQ